MELNEPYAKERDCPNCGKVVDHCNAWICGKCGAYFKDRPQKEKKYSVAELEKIHAWLVERNRNFTARTVVAFLSKLKDKKKVEEILDER